MIVQLSDLHIGATDGGDPATDLAAAVRRVAELAGPIDAVLVSGDLAEHGLPEEYELARELLAPLGAPILPLPGNHDHQQALYAAFPEIQELATARDERAGYAASVGELRVVACDSTVTGRPEGRFDPERGEWLDRTLAEAPEHPTIVATHHPPFRIGMPELDAIGLSGQDRSRLRSVLAGHPHVQRVVSGHVHVPATASMSACPAITCPSTWQVRARLRLNAPGYELETQPAGFVLHLVEDGELVSHVQIFGA